MKPPGLTGERDRSTDRGKRESEEIVHAMQPNEKQRNCIYFYFVYSTYTAGDGAVPLRQGIGDRQAFSGTGSLQDVTWAALEAYHGADGEVVTHTAAISGLGD